MQHAKNHSTAPLSLSPPLFPFKPATHSLTHTRQQTLADADARENCI
jgi:hypothetical protein